MWAHTPGFPPRHTGPLWSAVLSAGIALGRRVCVCVCVCDVCVHAFIYGVVCVCVCVFVCVCELRLRAPLPAKCPCLGLPCPPVALGSSGGDQLANKEGTGMPCSLGLWTSPHHIGPFGLRGMTWPLLALKACQRHTIWSGKCSQPGHSPLTTAGL